MIMRRQAAVIVAGLALACSADKINSPTTGAVTQWIVDGMTIPLSGPQADQLGSDLDGDAVPDNQLGTVLAALTQAAGSGWDLQSGVDDGIASGVVVQLIGFQSDDTTLATDAAAAAHWYTGQPTAGFTTGAHTINGSVAAGSFVGILAARDYSSVDPVTAVTPVEVMLPLKLFSASDPIVLPLNGVHVQWHFSSTTGIASGKLTGSIRQDDVTNIFIPSLAQVLNATIQADTSSETAHTIEGLFDDGGCGSAVAGDNLIELCELQNNSLIQTLLAPDVRIYDASGTYHPASSGTANALSVGIGFTAVRTTF